MSSWPRCTPSAPVASTRSGRSLRMNSAPCSAQSRRNGPAASITSRSAASLHPQLHDVDAAAERAGEELLRPAVADQVQPRIRAGVRDGLPQRKSGSRMSSGASRYDRKPETLAADRLRSFDVAVAGGGAIGLAVAWRAARRGLRVVVLERDELGAGTSSVAAGMLAPVTEVEPQRAAAARARAAERRGISGLRPGAARRVGDRPRLPRVRLAARRPGRRRGGGARARARAPAIARPRGAAPASERGAPARARARADDPARARGPRRPRDRPEAPDRGARRGVPPRRRRAADRRRGGRDRDRVGSGGRRPARGRRARRGRAGRGRRRRLVGLDRRAPRRGAGGGQPGQGPDPPPARPRRPRAAERGAADGRRLHRPARRRPLRARRDDGGARLRHDGHRRARCSSCCARRSSSSPGSASS